MSINSLRELEQPCHSSWRIPTTRLELWAKLMFVPYCLVLQQGCPLPKITCGTESEDAYGIESEDA